MDNSTTEQRDALIAQFCGIAAGVSHIQAQELLATHDWDLELALASHFSSAEQDADDSNTADATYTGPRTLDGRPAPLSSVPSGSRPTQSAGGNAQRGLRTLRDLQGGGAAGPTHDEDDSDDENQDLYAGGEKSGLSVQNPSAPRDPQAAIREMIRRAGQNAPRPGGEDSEMQRSHFTGTAHTLGGDDVPSRTIPDPTPRQTGTPASPQQRELHIWRNGFSVDDGPLYRYDDPANARWLEMINRGQAPLEIMNVQRGQEVDVHLHPHREEDYVQPKKKYKAFSGQGQRLGSPTPGASSSEAVSVVPASSTAAGPASSSSASTATVEVDSTQPTVTLQIRLGDGTRLRSQFNTTHTIGDVYGFVDRASAASTQRAYVLMTTFPSNELSDRNQVLGDMAEFKRGGVVVQKWA